MVDPYTKIVLTVIALALVALVVRPWLEPRQVGAQGVVDVRVVGGAAVQVFPVDVRIR